MKTKNKQYEVILFQPYLRRFVLNFGRNLKQFKFTHYTKTTRPRTGYHTLISYDREILRRKLSWQTRLRRALGIPNVRIRLDRTGDLFFTYGCLLITPKPYCTYIETGLALYNYDLGIAKNPLAQLIVMFLATRRNCVRLIFLSEAAKKSFFTTVYYPSSVRKRLQAKSQVIYPIPIEKQQVSPKKWSGEIKLLFTGMFYIKGGLEVVHAFERQRRTHANVSLTMITPLHVISEKDLRHLESVAGLTLRDAKLSEEEMIEAYRSHDIFLLPTYREGFGLVLIEALAYGMPVIITDQYATIEMAVDGYNGFIYPNHPLKDYDPKTYQLFGHYYEPIYFYAELFRLQKKGKLKPIEEFLVTSMSRFLREPQLLEQFSKHSLALYKKKFDADKLSSQIEQVFLEAVNKSRKNKIKPNQGK
jgi:glycosyltransferase involved in cell wall biosynthesis